MALCGGTEPKVAQLHVICGLVRKDGRSAAPTLVRRHAPGQHGSDGQSVTGNIRICEDCNYG